jgi:hypothetical protein
LHRQRAYDLRSVWQRCEPAYQVTVAFFL